jgi:hypothetical protein
MPVSELLSAITDLSAPSYDGVCVRSRFASPEDIRWYNLLPRAVSDDSSLQWESLDSLEPSGDDLDAMVALFPAPQEWYEEDYDS